MGVISLKSNIKKNIQYRVVKTRRAICEGTDNVELYVCSTTFHLSWHVF